MAYDSRRGLVMLYGDRAADAATLWAWDGVKWTAHTAAGPGLRRHVKLAYDESRDRLVLYGGLDDSGRQMSSDTWEWDGARWEQFTAAGPGPRVSYSFAYDAERRRIVLFGGLSPSGARRDTWEWDGARWMLRAEQGPSVRGEAGAVFDRLTKRIVLAGGVSYEMVALPNGQSTASVQRKNLPQDTWAWDGQVWSAINAGGISRFGPMAVDPLSGSLLRIGGESDSSYHGDLWRLEREGWRLVAGAAVPPRHGGAVALDTRRKRLVLFGGAPKGGGSLGDLWEWDGARWQEIKPPAR